MKRLKDPIKDYHNFIKMVNDGEIDPDSPKGDISFNSRIKRLAVEFPKNVEVEATEEIRVDSSSIFISKGSVGKVLDIGGMYTKTFWSWDDSPFLIRFDFEGFRFKIKSDGFNIRRVED